MRRLLLCLLPLLSACATASAAELRLPLADYRDHMEGGWLGQIAGVAWGAPTEFKWCGTLIPTDKVPAWSDTMMNQAFGQDDLYVEMTFLRSLELYGFDVSPRQAGIDFANTEFGLWCANRAGRENLRRGLAPPDSGHPHFSKSSDDIDYQIEADYAGLIAPGLPQTVLELGERFGRIMNYGDGLYGGVFMGGMYAAAFFEREPERLVEAGLRCIPRDSLYAAMVRDLLQWHRELPQNWEQAWERVNRKWFADPAGHPYAGGGIDAKTNGAAVLLGLLYGDSDPDRTITIAMRAGYDSDCNPSSAAGVLFAALGKHALPEHFRALKRDVKFAHTPYTFDELLAVSEQLARQAVVRAGGRVEKQPGGAEVFVIPVQTPRVGPAEKSWAPGPIAGSVFTPEERAQIRFEDELTRGLKLVAPGFTLVDCGPDMGAPALLESFRGRSNVLITHPLKQGVPDLLTREIAIAAGKRTTLVLAVSHHEAGDWELRVRVAGETVLTREVGPKTAPDGWLEVTMDLTPYAGKTVPVELVNQPTGWMCEAAYWGSVKVVEE